MFDDMLKFGERFVVWFFTFGTDVVFSRWWVARTKAAFWSGKVKRSRPRRELERGDASRDHILRSIFFVSQSAIMHTNTIKLLALLL